MKVLHVVYGFPPDPPGGTELYVEALCEELRPLGVHSVVAAPGPAESAYQHRDLTVHRFLAATGELTLGEQYGSGQAAVAAAFDRILTKERPDIVHQHALTSACSAHVIRLAKRRGIPVVFTYHTPTVSCQRGTLLERGRTVCDGHVSVARCTPCTLHALGLDEAKSTLLARTPELAGEMLGKAGLEGGAWTALRMRRLMRLRVDHLTEVLSNAAACVSVTPWVHSVLRRNGVPEARITDSAHGVFGTRTRTAVVPTERSATLRMAHLGRVDPAKGTRLLVEAVRSLPDARLSLDIFGVVQNAGDAARLAELRAAAAGDGRIRFLPPIPHANVVETLTAYDLVAVPSQGFETGPLVVLEAFAAGVPVIGSSIGGVADKVEHGKNGWLVKPHGSVEAWSAAISQCESDRDLVAKLRSGVRMPRTMGDVAREMKSLYLTLLAADVRTRDRVSRAAEVGRRRRVLYLQYTNPGGYPPLVHSAHQLANAGFDVLMLGLDNHAGALAVDPHPRIRVVLKPIERSGWRQKIHYLRFALTTALWVARWRPDWIYASDPLACPLALTVRPSGSRLIYHEHDSPSGEVGSNESWFGRLVRRARTAVAARAELCILPNARRAEIFCEVTGRTRASVVWNTPGVAEIVSPRDGTSTGELRVLYHGSIVPSRLPLAVVEALARLPEGVSLSVVGYETAGHAGYLSTLVERAKVLGVAHRLHLGGTLTRSELMAHAATCHVGLALMPRASADVNLREMVGASNKPFDYMACGLALLVSDLPEWQATYVEPGFARTCDPDSAEQFEQNLRWFWEHREAAVAMGERGRQKIRSEWNYESSFAPVLTRIVASSSPAAPEPAIGPAARMSGQLER